MATTEEVDAKKQKFGAEEALPLLTGMTKMLVAKGKSVKEIDLKKQRPTDEELTKLMLGPTGNLRAPTIRVGKTVLIGFHEETYAAVFA